MTELSPAAQAVWDAYETADCDPYETDPRRASLSDAFSALADEVISKVSPPCEDFDEYAQGFLSAHVKYRSEILAIAAELRPTTTQENN